MSRRWLTPGLLVPVGILVVAMLLYFVVAPAIAAPFHEDRLHRQEQCADKGGVMLRISDGPVTCFTGLQKVDL